MPDPGEPIQGWSCAGAIVVDVAAAGGVIGLCGIGAVRAALKALTTWQNRVVIITADCVQALYGGVPPERATVAPTLDEAIGLVHAESVERIRSGEVDGARQVWLCAQADVQQARLRSLFGEVSRYGIRAVLLGYWPYGLSLTVDDDGRILSAPPEAEELTGSYLTTFPLKGESPTAHSIVRAETPKPPGLDGSQSANAGRPRLLILGPEGISVDSVELPGLLERRFSWEVATYLACHPEGVAADTLIEDLWPDEPILSARKRFTDAVYHLRRALRAASGDTAAKFVIHRMNRYRLDEQALDVDMWDFDRAILLGRSGADDAERLKRLQSAAETYRGEFVHIGDGLWAESFRHDLRRKAGGALDELASLLERSDSGSAITMLERAIKIMPGSEEADRHIMRIYDRLDRSDDVRAAYETLKQRLLRLGEEPSMETRDLLCELTTHTGPVT